MDSLKSQFLEAVLGVDGARALIKASERNEALENALVPRTILAWISLAARAEYEGAVPGVDNTYIALKKTEAGYSGGVMVGDDMYNFCDEGLYHVAASIAVVMGVDHEKVPASLRDRDLARLGKSIDLLVKARVLSDDILQKKVLDPSLGYTFRHDQEDYTDAGGKFTLTTVHAFAPTGEKIGEAELLHNHQTGITESLGTTVHEAHRRRGVASAMYAHAEKHAGLKISPSNVQTPAGKALWAGNAQQGQFGLQKKDLPGQAAKPTEAAGPITPDAPTRQQAAPPKPKLPRRQVPPKPPLPKLPSLKLSEKQLAKRCRECDGLMVKNEQFVGCMCWRSMAQGVKLAKNHDGSVQLTFGKPWDNEAIEAFLASVR